MTYALTKPLLEKALPKGVRVTISDDLLDTINNLNDDPAIVESIKDNIIGYTHVLKDGKYKISSYIDAVKYVSYKLFGNTNKQAYIKTFPDRYSRFLREGYNDDQIEKFVYAYNKNKLVNLILEQTLVPTHVLNSDLYQKALNVQADLMINARSEKVRSDAANSLLTHLKLPEKQEINLNLGSSNDSAIEELKQTTRELAIQQKKMLEAKVMSAKDIAESKLSVIDGEIIDD